MEKTLNFIKELAKNSLGLIDAALLVAIIEKDVDGIEDGIIDFEIDVEDDINAGVVKREDCDKYVTMLKEFIKQINQEKLNSFTQQVIFPPDPMKARCPKPEDLELPQPKPQQFDFSKAPTEEQWKKIKDKILDTAEKNKAGYEGFISTFMVKAHMAAILFGEKSFKNAVTAGRWSSEQETYTKRCIATLVKDKFIRQATVLLENDKKASLVKGKTNLQLWDGKSPIKEITSYFVMSR